MQHHVAGMRGVFIRMVISLVVIQIIHIPRLALGEAENDTPVRVDGHGIKALKVAFEQVQPIPGRSMSAADRAAFSRARIRRNLSACSAATPRVSSSSNNRRRPMILLTLPWSTKAT